MLKSRQQLTLGKLIRYLDKCPGNALVRWNSIDGPAFGDVHSYRGYYSDLELGLRQSRALRPGERLHPAERERYRRLSTASGLGGYLKLAVLNKTFMGYKGGDYVMRKNTPVWVGTFGEADGNMLVRIERRLPVGDYPCKAEFVVLLTQREG